MSFHTLILFFLHCRCGDIFCKECASYQRRLNNLAHPDPNGKLYKVSNSDFSAVNLEIGSPISILVLLSENFTPFDF